MLTAVEVRYMIHMHYFDAAPYSVEREIEDLGALIAEVGGKASVYGHSSGAGLALQAAAHGLHIAKLVLHESPYVPDSEEERRTSQEYAENLKTLLAQLFSDSRSSIKAKWGARDPLFTENSRKAILRNLNSYAPILMRCRGVGKRA